MSNHDELKAYNKLRRVYQAKLARALECLDFVLNLSKDDIIKKEVKTALKEIRGNIKEEK